MSSASDKEIDHSQHIDIQDDRVSPREDDEDAGHGMKNSKGWDGKLRVPKSALLSNPEALSDPEYSDDDNVLPGDEIRADEGTHTQVVFTKLCPHQLMNLDCVRFTGR